MMTSKYNSSFPRFSELVGSKVEAYYELSSQIGGVVEKQSKLFSGALEEHKKFALSILDSPVSVKKDVDAAACKLRESIETAQGIEEPGRNRSFDSNLAAIREGIPCLFWICQNEVSPHDFVKDYVDASNFYLDRILRANKTSNEVQYKWAKAVKDMFVGLLEYSKLQDVSVEISQKVDSSKGINAKDACSDGAAVPEHAFGVANLFNQLRSIGSASAVLKKRKDGSPPKKSPVISKPSNPPQVLNTSSSSPPEKKKSNIIDGNKWTISGYTNTTFDLDSAEMSHTLYFYDCKDCRITVKNKINGIVMDNCQCIVVELKDMISQVELSKSSSSKFYLNGTVPTFTVDLCEDIELYLNEISTSVEVYTSRSSVINLMLPSGDGDFVEKTIPQLFKTVIKDGEIITEDTKFTS